VFAVLADPTTHGVDRRHRLGAGVRRPRTADRGGADLPDGHVHSGHPDGDYRVVNQIVALDPPCAIGWRTGQELGDGNHGVRRLDLALRLKSVDQSQTEMTLTYDWSAVPQYIRDRGIQFPPFGPDHLINSLHHLAELTKSVH